MKTPLPSVSQLFAAITTAALLGTGGCTTLNNVIGFEEQVERANQLVRITGRVDAEQPQVGDLIVVLAAPLVPGDTPIEPGADGRPRDHRGVDSYSRANPGTYKFIVDPGAYRVGAYEDRNKNGMLDTGERVVPFRDHELLETAPGETLSVDLLLSDAVTHQGAAVDVLGLVERDAHEQGLFSLGTFTQKGKVTSLNKEQFGQEMGVFGLWNPLDFLNEELSGVYFLEQYDPKRVPVLFVHGILGYPQEFTKLIAAVDGEQFQPWFYYYPSGFDLNSISTHLSDILRELQIRHDFDEMAIVAHSMGGLVARGAIMKYIADTQRQDIKLFISINTPFGGDVKAEKAEQSRIELPHSFADMSPNSAYMSWLFYEDGEHSKFRALPEHTAHHMIIGFNGSGSPCNDGAVSCASQAFPALQQRAASVRAWDFTHTGTLKQKRTIERVRLLLHEAF